ncbi:MAG: lipid-A-disaccharide synthase N-terminal domain-containing protein [Phycisphaerales bacterium]|nr:lipid-A-disaccharide synthase N-terminal domain-containing protein [Phycisphaerales bacterium]
MTARLGSTPGAVVSTLDLGARKIVYERLETPGAGASYRFLTEAPDLPSAPLAADAFWSVVDAVERETVRRHWLLRAFNITSWGNLAWIALGLGGQMAFFGRMFVQWVASERERRSVVPAAFWWLSLIGGLALFSYFIWRRDVVGVLGQSTGVVIYARNLRLIAKARRRARRDDTAAFEAGLAREDPSGEPVG